MGNYSRSEEIAARWTDCTLVLKFVTLLRILPFIIKGEIWIISKQFLTHEKSFQLPTYLIVHFHSKISFICYSEILIRLKRSSNFHFVEILTLRVYPKMTKKSPKNNCKSWTSRRRFDECEMTPRGPARSFLTQNWTKSTMHTVVLPKIYGICPNFDFFIVRFYLSDKFIDKF